MTAFMSCEGPEQLVPTSRTPRRLVLVGPPGAGKSSQWTRLALQLGVGYISTGQFLREEVRRESPLGIPAREYMGGGGLVPDWLVLDVVEHHLDGPSTLEKSRSESPSSMNDEGRS